MVDVVSMRREVRYGMPAADQIVFNRYYILGYSYYFRQAKWALEIVDNNHTRVKRTNTFRPDYRIPQMFRADLVDYKHSGYDRGHLIASADQQETELQNSETFLLSNMSPQVPKFNQGIWGTLEDLIRDLDAKPEILETYVITGPIFYFDQPVKFIGTGDDNGIAIPIPNAYFKSILTENNKGNLHMWSFIFRNQDAHDPIESFQVTTEKVERYAGIKLWSGLEGSEMERSNIRDMWA